MSVSRSRTDRRPFPARSGEMKAKRPMAKRKPKRGGAHHKPEVKAEAIAILTRGDRTIQQVADSLAVSTKTVRRWWAAAERLGDRRPLDAAERRDYERVKAALAQAEKRLTQLELQVEIQKKFQT